MVTLGSPNARTNLNWEKTPEELALERANRERMRMKRPARLSMDPFTLDLARRDGKATPKDPLKAARDLVYGGKTWVTDSRPIRRPDGSPWLRKRDGQPWIRRGHERRTIAEGDRTNVGYKVTSSRTDLGLEIGPHGPVRRLDEPQG